MSLSSTLRITGYLMKFIFWKLTSGIAKKTGVCRHKDAQISYQVYGSGEAVVLLHGGLSNKLCWFSQIPFLVKNGRQVILVDTRGHGRSTMGAETLTYQLFAEDVVLIMDRLLLRQSDIVGWSDGGITALVIARDYPDRAKRIIAISANTSPQGLTMKAQRLLATKYISAASWLRSKWSGSGRYFGQLDKNIRHIWSLPNLQDSDLSGIQLPVLVVVGDDDVVTVEHSKQISGLLQLGQFVVIKGGGHATPMTHSTRMNQLIQQFLKFDNTQSRKHSD